MEIVCIYRNGCSAYVEQTWWDACRRMKRAEGPRDSEGECRGLHSWYRYGSTSNVQRNHEVDRRSFRYDDMINLRSLCTDAAIWIIHQEYCSDPLSYPQVPTQHALPRYPTKPSHSIYTVPSFHVSICNFLQRTQMRRCIAQASDFPILPPPHHQALVSIRYCLSQNPKGFDGARNITVSHVATATTLTKDPSQKK